MPPDQTSPGAPQTELQSGATVPIAAADPFRLDRRSIARSFDRASGGYDRSARLQSEVRAELLDRLQFAKLTPAVILDLGSGTGHASRELRQRYRKALVVASDLAPGMLDEARHQVSFLRRFERVCADAARLPLADASVDLVFSNLMLQWCAPPDAVFREVQRVLRPGGLFTFTTFGPDTLRELRESWEAADAGHHVNRFIDMHDVGDALGRAGFAEPVLDVDRHVLDYPDALSLMRDLKAIGAHNVMSGRPRGLTGRRALARMTASYEARRHNDRLPATFEVIYGMAWGTPPRGAAADGGEVVVPLARISRRGLSR